MAQQLLIYSWLLFAIVFGLHSLFYKLLKNEREMYRFFMNYYLRKYAQASGRNWIDLMCEFQVMKQNYILKGGDVKLPELDLTEDKPNA